MRSFYFLQNVFIRDGESNFPHWFLQGEENARRSSLLNSDELITYYYDDVRTVYEIFQRGLHVSNNGPCLGVRKPNQPYEWISYKEVSSLSHLILDLLFLLRLLWVIIEQSCYTYSMVVVPLYDTLGTEAITYIVNKADLSLVFCDTPEKAKLLLTAVEKGETPILSTIVIMEPFGTDLVERGKKCGVEVFSMREIEPDYNLRNPKGAMITHKNIVSNSSAFLKTTEKTFVPSPEDVLISFLPLAHMFERIVECVVLCHGARIGFFQGDIRLLMDDLKTLQPTVFPVVPRLLNRMFDKIFGQADTSLKKWMLDFASKRKEAELRSGIIRNNSFWDKVIFRKIQASLGGKVRLMITGAAPVSASVLTFLRTALGCQFYEGYGQTECTAGCSLSMPGDWTAGHVGAPMACNIIKLVDVQEMNYLAAKGEGEAFLIGVVVPDPETLCKWAKKKGFEGSYEKLCKNKDVKKHILEDMVRVGKESGLKSFEQVKDIIVHTEMFSIENGLLTPTLKAKRPELRKYFQSQIDELYANTKM
uniref:long-chain-fatty-acid--CoA ligase n=1 Tax=Pavo cristatus TaxID=9049 RepID=A0A8C9FG58_PAVCR